MTTAATLGILAKLVGPRFGLLEHVQQLPIGHGVFEQGQVALGLTAPASMKAIPTVSPKTSKPMATSAYTGSARKLEDDLIGPLERAPRQEEMYRQQGPQTILVAVFHILDRLVPYQDLGDDWFIRQREPRIG